MKYTSIDFRHRRTSICFGLLVFLCSSWSLKAQDPIQCGVINTLYQTRGNSATSLAEVFRYNPFLQEYVKVGELDGVANNSASNSAYNAETKLVYSSIGTALRAYDPANGFSFVGEITITGNNTNFNQTLFAQDEFVGFVNDNKIVRFDVTGITSYPAVLPVIETDLNPPPSGEANDYSLLDGFIYGASGNQLYVIEVATGNTVVRDLNLVGSVGNASNSWGASWQDRDGNWYVFNNGNGNIYRVFDIENTLIANPAPGVIDLQRVLIADTSNQNDGFGCELQPNPLDWDGDGIEDIIDLDDDNDGILDAAEFFGLTDPFGDTDGDNIPNYNDPDTAGFLDNDANGINDLYDVDGDGIPNAFDLDSDNDGLPDNIEAQSTAGYIAPNGVYDPLTGIDTAYGNGLDATEVSNTDAGLNISDTIPDYLDNDSDNDGLTDTQEAFGSIAVTGIDTDFDGIDNAFDTLGEGATEVGAAQNTLDPGNLPDQDSDLASGGDVDYRDVQDKDGDGIIDDIDLDDDNDGIPDTSEFSGSNDPFGDADGDGLINLIDTNDNGSTGDGSITDYTDSNSDGIPDVYDTDLDGVPNHLDIDADNDGITDATEAGGEDNDANGAIDGFTDTDNDGLDDATAVTPLPIPNSDGNANDGPDYLDIDADDDGIPDNIEAQTTAGYLAPSGNDMDGDGLDDNYDADNGGSSLIPVNTDGANDAPDYLDLDSDNDGSSDLLEAGRGAFSDIDTDGDGLDDGFEGANTNDPTDVNDEIDDPSTLPDKQAGGDVDFRDNPDNDRDGIPDSVDLDDDNDGIPDSTECGDPNEVGNTDNSTGTFGDQLAFIAWTGDFADGIDVGDQVTQTLSDGSQITLTVIAANSASNSFVPNTISTFAGAILQQEYDDLDDNYALYNTSAFRGAELDVTFSVVGTTAGGNPFNPSAVFTDGESSDTGESNEAITNGTAWELIDQVGYTGTGPTITGLGTNEVIFQNTDLGVPLVRSDNVTQLRFRTTDPSNIGLQALTFAFLTLADDDQDGIVNCFDRDSDNDGLTDAFEAGGTDANGDGIIDGFIDANNDGLDDTVAATPLPLTDTDGLGGPDYLDIDADNDGIVDNIEAQTTAAYQPPLGADDDGDGIDNQYDPDFAGSTPISIADTDQDTDPDFRDLDSDNDTIIDSIEAWDTDADGTPETLPTNSDQDNDGLDDAYDNDDADPNPTNGQLPTDFPDAQNPGNDRDWRQALDNDNDGIPDNIDLDDDNDGIPDTAENGGNDPFADTDNDGTPDYVDTDAPGFIDSNNDGIDDRFDNDQDGIIDQFDLDSDNDGIPDVTEAGGEDADGDGIIDGFTDTNNDGLDDATAATPLPNPDSDGDGINDVLDLDSDNDGITDVTEAGGEDADGDGTIDNFTDTDNDGLADSVDPVGPTTPGTPLENPDTDGDGVNDYLDVDSDNDGITDITEADGEDADGDGRIDNFTDTDNDGLTDSVDPVGPATAGTPLPVEDFDGDGRPNYLDIDSDNDGITDTTEAGGEDTDGNGEIDGFTDADNDGLDDATAASPLPIPNSDGNANDGPDYLDIDADDDGIPDNVEAQTTAGYIAPSGNDTDGDGLDDNYDTDNGGTAITPVNTDGANDAPDYLDLDSDNDGLTDLVEAGRGTFIGTDEDNDGLDDGFEGANDNDPTDVNDEIDDPTNLPDTQPGGDVDYRQTLDNDNDGIPDNVDLDDDNDGIPDTAENGGNDPFADTDNDGTPDYVDTDAPGFVDSNNDGIDDRFDNDQDGIIDQFDLDSDNDGIPDVTEAGGEDANGDGIIDGFTDTNNDGLDDATAATPLPNPDSDGDGINDVLDLDSDNDGIPDVTEAGGEDADGDGTIDNFTDTDNDGLADSVDPVGPATAGTPLENPDTDNDGVDDRLDLDSDNDGITDVTEAGGEDADGDGRIDNFTDTDNDGLADSVDPVGPATVGTPLPVEDFDGDGRPNYLDIDSDNDGITDTTEAGGEDTDGNGEIDGFTDADNDGLDDATAASPLPIPNSDGNANDGPNYLDIDADDDGIVDNIEGQSTEGYIAPRIMDADNDGLDDAYDTDNGGTAIVPVDTDADQTPDYLDLDTDNDGIADSIEGWDVDGDGTADTLPAGTDADGDGLDDAYDTDDANADPTNDQVPTDFPDVQVTGGDRDWRQGADADGDGVLDDTEIADGTDPNNPCDFDIASITEPQGGDYLLADCDGDGVTNGDELAGPDGDPLTLGDATNPEDACDFDEESVTVAVSGDYLITDCDGDGVTNGDEITDGTDPADACDFLEPSISLDRTGDYLIADCDGDGIPNGQEITDGTNPNDPCSSRGGTPPAGTACDIIFESDLVQPGLNNGVFTITNIESFPNNTVRIYNRWGVLVFETETYDNADNAFSGISNGRATINKNEELPVGVYFYIVNYEVDGENRTKNGYLYVNR